MFKLGTLRTAALAAAVTMLSAGAAAAAPYTDTVQAPTGYFVPNPVQLATHGRLMAANTADTTRMLAT